MAEAQDPAPDLGLFYTVVSPEDMVETGEGVLDVVSPEDMVGGDWRGSMGCCFSSGYGGWRLESQYWMLFIGSWFRLWMLCWSVGIRRNMGFSCILRCIPNFLSSVFVESLADEYLIICYNNRFIMHLLDRKSVV